MASTFANPATAAEKLNWAAPAQIKATTAIQPFDDASFDVPSDVLALASSVHCAYIPLSLLTRTAIHAYKTGLRPALLDPKSDKYEPLQLEPYCNLEEVMEFSDWSQAMSMLHLVFQQVLGEESCKRFGRWLRHHEQNVRARYSEDAWPILRRYDIDIRTLFWDQYRKAESTTGQDGMGQGFDMPVWETKAYETTAAAFGTTPGDLASIFRDGDTFFSEKDKRVTPALAAAVEQTQRLKETAKAAAIQRLKVSGRILTGNTSLASGRPPSPISPSASRPSPPTPQQHSLYQQPPHMQQHQPAALSAGNQHQQAFAQLGGPLPSGTLPPLHPSSRLAPPSAVDAFNASRRFGAPRGSGTWGGSGSGRPRRCPMCGVTNPNNSWQDCVGWDPEVLYRLGRGFAIRGTTSVVCANFNAVSGCSNFDCTFVHGCTCCRFVGNNCARGHGRADCRSTSLHSLPPAPYFGGGSGSGSGGGFGGGGGGSGYGRGGGAGPPDAGNLSGYTAGGGVGRGTPASGTNSLPTKRPASTDLTRKDDPVLSGLREGGPALPDLILADFFIAFPILLLASVLFSPDSLPNVFSHSLPALPSPIVSPSTPPSPTVPSPSPQLQVGPADISHRACSDSDFFASLPPPRDPLLELHHNPSRLNADAFANYLSRLPNYQASPYVTVPDQIRQGFHLGIDHAIVEHFFPPNAQMS
ncbi:hypothetical protein JCM1840_007368 [Sporobolomyces johnsonii]